jgi:GNAT superfamily N-acetyltransferase
VLHRYFNYRFHFAESGWQRREYASHWWHIYKDDPRWVPPPWRPLLRLLSVNHPPHLARMDPMLLYGEALPRRIAPHSPNRNDLSPLSGVLFEEPVVAAVLLRDRRRRDGAAYAAWLHVANDAEVLARFLTSAGDALQPLGVRQIILPTGLSPYLSTGVLQDHFHQLPPLHTPYNPPYVPELMTTVCRPVGRSLLYTVDVTAHPTVSVSSPATLRPLEPQRLAGDLLPLFVQTMPTWADFPLPDELEASFLLMWIRRWPLLGWVAEVAGAPVGFVLLQPDLSPLLRQSGGGRRLWWRPWLAWRAGKAAVSGRLLFGGVLPDHRRQGIGRQLWQQALNSAKQAGWKTLSYGPVPSIAQANNFFQAQSVDPQRTYLLHRYEFS